MALFKLCDYFIEMPFQERNALFVAQISDWSQRGNPALRELLDHLAEQLAMEYVRLMKIAAEREAGK